MIPPMVGLRWIFVITLMTWTPGPGRAGAWSPQVLPGSEQAGLVTGLAIDPEGRLWAAVTRRAFGRGTVVASARPELAADDARLTSVEDRRRLLLRWLNEEKIPPGNDPEILTRESEAIVALPDPRGTASSHPPHRALSAAFNEPETGPAAGLAAAASGHLLFACAPSLWRIAPAEGTIHPVVSGLGVRSGSGGPGVLAPITLPNGDLAFLTSQRGSRPESPASGRLPLHDDAALFRCSPDGSHLRPLATGLLNPSALCVDPVGRIWFSEITGPQSTRLHCLQPGSTLPEKPIELPGIITCLLPDPSAPVSTDSVSFLAGFGPGTESGIRRLVTTRAASGWQLSNAASLWSGGSTTAMAISPEGSVFWTDWGSTFSADSSCRILKANALPDALVPAWASGAVFLRDDPLRLSDAQLSERLRSLHPPLRAMAAREVIRRATPELAAVCHAVASDPELPPGNRLTALHCLADLAARRPEFTAELLACASLPEVTLREATALRLPECEPGIATPVAHRLLSDPAPAVAAAALIAAAALDPAATAVHLLPRLTDPLPTDHALRAALTACLARCLAPEELADRIRSETPAATRALLFASLRHAGHPSAADALLDPDPALAAAAAIRLYDDLFLSAWPAIAALADRCGTNPAFSHPELIARMLAAAQRTGTAAAAQTVRRLLELPEAMLPPATRLLALETLASWHQPPDLDPVHNRPITPVPRSPDAARPALRAILPRLLEGPLASRAREIARQIAAPAAERLVTETLDPSKSESARLLALRLLSETSPSLAAQSAWRLIRPPTPPAAMPPASIPAAGEPFPPPAPPPPPNPQPAALLAEARRITLQQSPGSLPAQLSTALDAGTAPELQTVLRALDRYQGNDSEQLWGLVVSRWLLGQPDPACHVEILEALTSRDHEPRSRWRRWLEQWDASLRSNLDPLARWRMTMAGGDPAIGRMVFESHPSAQCLSCHQVDARGGSIGPEIDGLAGRLSPSAILEALITPSQKCQPRFACHSVTLNDGSIRSGRIVRRDTTETVLDTGTSQYSLPAAAIASVSETASPMPSVATILTPREIRDLMAWLTSLK
jgi:quinoprotein glucose dehydrogenase